jgi:hypothetical protein
LLEQLRIAHNDGSHARLMGQLAKPDLMILTIGGSASSPPPSAPTS